MIAAALFERKLELLEFYDDYGAALDDALEAWPEFFTDAALYRIVARENYERDMLWPTMSCEGRGMRLDRVMAIRETAMYAPRRMRHFITGVRVLGETVEGELRTQANFLVAESQVESESRVFAVGRYFDRIVRAGDGKLRFADKLCVYDGDVILSSLIYPL